MAATRRSAPYDPAPPLPRTPPPRTPAEAWLGQLLAELQRWPDAKCKCKLLWKPQQRRVPNPEQDLAPGTSGSAPHIPLVSAAPRPHEVLLFSAPSPEMPGVQEAAPSTFSLWGLSPARFWLFEPSEESRSF